MTPQELQTNLKSKEWRLNNLYYIKDQNGKKVLFRMNFAQQQFYNNMHGRDVILKARQLGFTTFIQIYMLDEAIFRPYTACGTIAHRLDDAKDIVERKINFAYENLPDAIKQLIPKIKDNATQVQFGNGSSITVGTSLRSGTYQCLHISEYGKIWAQFPEKGEEIKTGALNTVHVDGKVFIESTAEGKVGDFYEKCQSTRVLTATGQQLNKLQYKFHFFPWWQDDRYVIGDSQPLPNVLVNYFQKLERESGITLTDQQQQWYYAKWNEQRDMMKREYPATPDEAFESIIDGSYYAELISRHLEDKGRITSVPYAPNYPVHTAWDLGVHDHTAIWFLQEVGMDIRVIDYYEDSGKGLSHYSGELKAKGYNYGRHYWPHDGDHREFSTGVSRKETMRKHGFNVQIVPIHRVEDRIEAMRNIIPRLVIDHHNCARGLQCIKEYRREWNDKLLTFSKNPLHNWASHGADALGCYAMGRVDPQPRRNVNNKRKPFLA